MPGGTHAAMGSRGSAGEWQPLQAPIVTIGTVAGLPGTKPTGSTSTSTPGANRTGGLPGTNVTPWSPWWIGWQVEQRIARLARAFAWPARTEPWLPWQEVHASAATVLSSGLWQLVQARPAFACGRESGPGAA